MQNQGKNRHLMLFFEIISSNNVYYFLISSKYGTQQVKKDSDQSLKVITGQRMPSYLFMMWALNLLSIVLEIGWEKSKNMQAPKSFEFLLVCALVLLF